MTKPTNFDIARSFGLWREYVDTDCVCAEDEFNHMSIEGRLKAMADAFGLRKYVIHNTLSAVVLGEVWAENESDALEEMARDAGYESYRDACEVAPVKAGEIVVELAEGHQE